MLVKYGSNNNMKLKREWPSFIFTWWDWYTHSDFCYLAFSHFCIQNKHSYWEFSFRKKKKWFGWRKCCTKHIQLHILRGFIVGNLLCRSQHWDGEWHRNRIYTRNFDVHLCDAIQKRLSMCLVTFRRDLPNEFILKL